jgi:hypothetical protein
MSSSNEQERNTFDTSILNTGFISRHPFDEISRM